MAHSQKLFKFLPILAAASTLALSACTKKNEAGTVSITMPATIATTSGKADVTAQSTTNNWNTSLNPTVGSEINCYAIFVAGSGLDGSTCQVSDAGVTSTIKFGPFVGLLPSGAATTLEVPSGSDRVFHVVGFRASSATACASTVLPGNVVNSLFSEPFLIASKLAEVPSGPSTLAIQPVLNLQKKIVDCQLKGSTNSGGGGGTSSGILSWGDKRDGGILLQSGTARTLTVGANAYAGTAGLNYSPNSGGVSSTKVLGASRQVTNVDAGTGLTLTLGSSFSAGEFEVGDEVLWYVSAGNAATSPDDPDVGACGSTLYRGRYGTSTITATSGLTVTLSSKIADDPTKIKNTNLTAPINATAFCRISLNRIPNFDQFKVDAGGVWTITSAPYVPSTGTDGVVVLRAKRLEVNGNLKIDNTGKGFYGGAGTYPGSSVAGPGGFGNNFGNASGGGTSAAGSAAGGAGAGQGGYVGTMSYGGAPINYCENSTYTAIASGTYYACGIADDGDLKCWGSGTAGALGDGTLSSRTIPSTVAGGLKFQSVSAGATHTCAIQAATGKLFCWGYNGSGQLGDGSVTTSLTPKAIDVSNSYSSVAVGNSSTCGILTSGALRCWGYGYNGEIGNGASVNALTPVTIDSGVPYGSVSAGGTHICAVTTGLDLKCWGDNTLGKLGDGTTTSRNVPTLVGPGYLSVSAGKANSTCAVTSGSVVKCWGDNSTGQLGDGTTSSRVLPAAVAGAAVFKSVAVGLQHACGVTTDLHIACWGYNTVGTLGDGTFTQRLTPTFIDATTTYSIVSSSPYNSCGITTSGQVKCWGQNTSGQLGNNSISTSNNAPSVANLQRTCLPFTSQKAYFGGGGGGSSTTHSGGTGGGLVLVFAREIIGTGALSIVSNGADGTGTVSVVGSGGGGGGTIALANRILGLANVIVQSAGGFGFNAGGNPSAGGGGGTIEIKHCSTESAALAVSTLAADVQGGSGFTGSDSGALGQINRIDLLSTCSID